jgi:hypothetical protein
MKGFEELDPKLLTKTEKKVLEMYTSGESLWINNYLRERNLDQLNEFQREKMKQYANHLNNLIHKSPPSYKQTKVYRGAEAMDEKWKNLNTNDELLFTQKGLISTSFNLEAAVDFIERDSDCCLLVLRLPKNTKGLYIGSSSIFNDLSEDELLLPHGSKFIVAYRRVNHIGGKQIITYYADLLSQ